MLDILREEGSSGEAKVEIEIVPVKDASFGMPAKEGIDFKPLETPTIVFDAGQAK